jgi:hypothetical protein
MANAEEEKEIRAQRHDFIKEYYKMATADLDRHLKGGWQAIAVLAGGAAILTAGHDEKIGLPIAISFALLSAFWGAAMVMDANYWSLRAIAFLSNVEVVYFSSQDRKRFNPYIGFHPPFKLMNSLRFVFIACVTFAMICIGDLLWERRGDLASITRFIDVIRSKSPAELLLWGMPFLVLAWGLALLARIQLKRLRDYRKFSSESPGPGIRTQENVFRHVTLQALTGEQLPKVEANLQEHNIRKMNEYEPTANAIWFVSLGWAIVTSAMLVVVALKLPA